MLGKLKSGNSNRESKDEEIPMTEEDIKLFELTKNNTITNRDVLNKEKEYMKTIKPKYQEIYGDKGVKFCEEEKKNEIENVKENMNENGDGNGNANQNEQIKERKRKSKVKFSSFVEYSRN